jgi:hypothetical protein
MPLLDEAVVNKAVRALLKFHENQRLRAAGRLHCRLGAGLGELEDARK